MGRVFSNLLYYQYGYLNYIQKQAIPVTAVDEALMAWAALKGLSLTPAEALMAWAALKGLSLTPAAPAQGQVTFTGTPGAVVSDGTVLLSANNYYYAVPSGYGGTITSNGTFTTTVISTTAGFDSNLSMGSPATTLQLQITVPGVLPTVTLASNLTGGTDIETQASLSARLIQVFSNPPQGGAPQDYVTWALSYPTVTRAWVGGNLMGSGTVVVYFAEDIVEAQYNGLPQGVNGGSAYDSRIPTAAGDQLLLANYLYPLRPATAMVYAMSPVGVPLNLTLSEVPDDTTIRASITTALQSFLLREASVGGTLDQNLNANGTVHISDLWTALAAVDGLDYFDIVSPTADITVATGQLSIPGQIFYQDPS